MPEFNVPAADSGNRPSLPDEKQLKTQFSSIVGFAGFGDLRQQFGGGGTVAKQQLDETKKLRDETKLNGRALNDINRTLEELKQLGGVFA